jgi:hypothetical protein
MNRVEHYLNACVDELAARSAKAATGANRSDIGTNREDALLGFLSTHLPARLRPALGGLVIGSDGSESKQIDILISNDLGIRFEDNARPFAMAEGLAAAISVKSMLNSADISDAISNLASIPKPSPDVLSFPSLGPAAFAKFAEFHPSKIVFGYRGMTPQSTLEAVRASVEGIPRHEFGKLTVIVNGSHMVTCHIEEAVTRDGTPIPAGAIHLNTFPHEYRGMCLVRIVDRLSKYGTHLNYMVVDTNPYLQWRAPS